MAQLQITVIGNSQADTETAELAAEVGKHLAPTGAALICGGRGGVMEAACRAYKQHGGKLSVGILMKKQASDANQFLDLIIPTGLSEARNLANVLAGQAVIAVGGAEGTLSELAFAIKNNRPIFGVNTWEHPRFNFPARLSAEQAVRQAVAAAQQVTL